MICRSKMENIAQNIKTVRRLKGFSQEQFAFDLGISTNSYFKIENGKTDINLSRLQQIVKLLGYESLFDFLNFCNTINQQKQ